MTDRGEGFARYEKDELFDDVVYLVYIGNEEIACLDDPRDAIDVVTTLNTAHQAALDAEFNKGVEAAAETIEKCIQGYPGQEIAEAIRRVGTV